MSVIRGRQLQADSTLHEIDVNLTISETDMTPFYLGTSKPGTPTISFTVNSGDLPVVSGISEYTMVLNAYCAGTNTDVTGHSVFGTIEINSTEVEDVSISVSSNYYWTYCVARDGIQVNDVVDIYLWCPTSALIEMDYNAWTIQISSFRLFPDNKETNTIVDVIVNYNDTTATPDLTGGVNPNGTNYSSLFMSAYKNLTNVYTDLNVYGYMLGGITQNDVSWPMFTIGYDYNTTVSSIRTSTSYHPYYLKSIGVTNLKYFLRRDV